MKLFNQDPDEGEYVGNFFGAKLTRYAAIIIGSLLLLVIARHYYLDVPFGFGDPDEPFIEDTLEVVDPHSVIDSIGN